VTKTVSISALAEAISPGESLYMPGSAAEPIDLLRALAERPERTRNLRILTSVVPGINRVALDALDALDASVEMTGLFMQPGLRGAQQEGRFRHLPVSFSGFVDHIRERVSVDSCVVTVSPPDAQGRCSLGASVEFTRLVQARSRRTLALINPRMPAIPGAQTLAYDAFALACEVDTPLPTYAPGAPSASAEVIARHISGFVEDGSALQAGLGKVPESLFGLLHDRRNLRLQSGMLGDGAFRLSQSAALDRSFTHSSCVWVGSSELYSHLGELRNFTVESCDITHDIGRLASMARFVAVNSALSVDLFGQANLEHAGGRSVSGVGGAPDFASAARLSRGGLSIVALPASYGEPALSRIVPRLEDGIVSLPRQMIDLVITEHGVADLRGLSVFARAEAMMAIAAPAFRSGLEQAWTDIRKRL
jgi:acyl-CoA hydrolase